MYNWSELPKDAVVNDIGGGNGHIVLELLKKFPHLRAVVQDLPSVLEDTRRVSNVFRFILRFRLISCQFWEENLPEAVKNDRVQFTPIDFFKDAPVEGCDIYIVSLISTYSIWTCRTMRAHQCLSGGKD